MRHASPGEGWRRGLEIADTEWRQQVGEALKRARQERGFTQRDIAERLKLRETFIAAVEEGDGRSHMDEGYERQHIRAIAQLLDVDIESAL
jgi:cytoskeleton protein RodZ